MALLDQLKLSGIYTRLRKHHRDQAALTLAAALEQQARDHNEVQRSEAVLADIEQDHHRRMASGQPLDLALITQAHTALDSARRHLLRARARLADSEQRCAQAQAAARTKEAEHGVADHWAGELRQQYRKELDTRDFNASLDAQSARSQHEPD